VPLIAFICVLELVRQRKKFSIEKYKIFSLSSLFDLRFLTQIFILQQCLDPNPIFVSDSDPAKTFGFPTLLTVFYVLQTEIQIFGTALLSVVPTITASSSMVGKQKVINAKLSFKGTKKFVKKSRVVDQDPDWIRIQ
jgi:hypothetical protein